MLWAPNTFLEVVLVAVGIVRFCVGRSWLAFLRGLAGFYFKKVFFKKKKKKEEEEEEEKEKEKEEEGEREHNNEQEKICRC